MRSSKKLEFKCFGIIAEERGRRKGGAREVSSPVEHQQRWDTQASDQQSCGMKVEGATAFA